MKDWRVSRMVKLLQSINREPTVAIFDLSDKALLNRIKRRAELHDILNIIGQWGIGGYVSELARRRNRR